MKYAYFATLFFLLGFVFCLTLWYIYQPDPEVEKAKKTADEILNPPKHLYWHGVRIDSVTVLQGEATERRIIKSNTFSHEGIINIIPLNDSTPPEYHL